MGSLSTKGWLDTGTREMCYELLVLIGFLTSQPVVELATREFRALQVGSL